MLKLLHIRNLAIIDEVTLELAGGFTVLTGETGAGKSILLDALGLVLGMRADPALIRQGADKAEIAAEFELADTPLALAWLRDNELLDEDEPEHCLIRRVLHAEGRTRAFQRTDIEVWLDTNFCPTCSAVVSWTAVRDIGTCEPARSITSVPALGLSTSRVSRSPIARR